jgi:hypothetical protein
MYYPFNAFGLLVDNCNLLKAGVININLLGGNNNKDRYLLIEDDGIAETIWGTEE